MTDRDKLRALWQMLGEPMREKKTTIYLPDQAKSFRFDEQGRLIAVNISAIEV